MVEINDKKICINEATEMPAIHFEEDLEEDIIQKTSVSGIVNGKKLCANYVTSESFADAPVISVPKDEYEFLLDCLEGFNQCKEKRAKIQKKYFETHKDEYYERQKKWRQQNSTRINARRREKYHEKKMIEVEPVTDVKSNIIPDEQLSQT